MTFRAGRNLKVEEKRDGEFILRVMTAFFTVRKLSNISCHHSMRFVVCQASIWCHKMFLVLKTLPKFRYSIPGWLLPNDILDLNFRVSDIALLEDISAKNIAFVMIVPPKRQ